MRLIFAISLAASLVTAALPATVRAHITPPVVYMSDRDAVLGMTTGAKKYFVREVKLTPEERRAIASKWGWSADDPFYRFYLGRDEKGQIVAAVAFLTEFTVHGPVRLAVALGPDGKVKDARIIEVTEEISTWVSPLVSGGFLRQFVGLDSSGSFIMPASHSMSQENMVHFYAEISLRLVQRGAILFDIAFLKRREM